MDGILVRDIRFGETFMFRERADGHCAEQGHLRLATEEEQEAWQRKQVAEASKRK